MGNWETLGHSKYKVISFLKDLLKIRQIIHDKPNLRFMGPIKLEFWAPKTPKVAKNVDLGHFWTSYIINII